jgi:hypothetical protein
VQFNDSGAPNGTSGFTFDKTTNSASLANTLSVNALSTNSISVGGTAVVNSTVITIGSVTVNASTLAIGANVFLSTTELTIGNSTVNAVANSTTINVGTLSTNSLTVGSNVTLGTVSLTIGNSTVNTFANSTILQTRILHTRGVLISELPASPTVGMRACVTDGDANLEWSDTVVNSGAGATKYLVWYNGSNWIVDGGDYVAPGGAGGVSAAEDLTNGVTGTGEVVLADAPTLTGQATFGTVQSTSYKFTAGNLYITGDGDWASINNGSGSTRNLQVNMFEAAFARFIPRALAFMGAGESMGTIVCCTTGRAGLSVGDVLIGGEEGDSSFYGVMYNGSVWKVICT